MAEENEKFLSRWARLKQGAREKDKTQQAPPVAPSAQANAGPPELPPIEELRFDSDFRGFLHPKIDENLRRAALKRLFSDPHFNVMDGLDVYIDDYSKPNPLPAEMLAALRQAQQILDWAKESAEHEKKQEPPVIPSKEMPRLEAQEDPPGAARSEPPATARGGEPGSNRDAGDLKG